MKVILRETHENLGRPGDVVDVKPGFARNYLIPQGIAYSHNKFYIRMFEEERDDLLKRDAELRAAAEGLAKKGEGAKVEFVVRMSNRGQMFGAITNRDIAEKLNEQGIEVDRRKIALPAPIKDPGEHLIVVKPHGDVAFDVIVMVIPEVVEEELSDELAEELAEAMGEGAEEAAEGTEGAEAAEAADGEAPAEGAEVVEVEPVEKPEATEEADATEAEGEEKE